MGSNGAEGTGLQLPRLKCELISDPCGCIGTMTEDTAEGRSRESVEVASCVVHRHGGKGKCRTERVSYEVHLRE